MAKPSVHKRIPVPRIYVPGTHVALLSEARKMPCLSWSLPAHASCPFAIGTDADHICGHCYAAKGRYRLGNVANAQRARYDWARQCMKTEQGRQDFEDFMVAAISRSSSRYFRVHDSGDLFSPWYAIVWGRIVRRLKRVLFWIPTRSWRALKATGTWMADYWRQALDFLASARNAIVRPSAERFDEPPPVVAGLAAGSSASRTGYTCPAHKHHNHCPDHCRRCWTQASAAVVYRRH